MSYDSICETCARKVCNARMDGLMHCDMRVPRETNYERLFGTPERAAESLTNLDAGTIDWCYMVESECAHCFQVYDRFGCCPREGVSLLEWLESEAI